MPGRLDWLFWDLHRLNIILLIVDVSRLHFTVVKISDRQHDAASLGS